MPVILGIDPGSRITGFGVVQVSDGKIQHVNHGVILLQKASTFAHRLLELGLALQEIIAKYKPDQVSVEKIFLGKNPDSAFKLGHARGVVIYEAMRAQVEVHEYATRVVKQGVTGSGGASKEEVQIVVARLLNLKAIARLDASDALAMAVHRAFQLQKNTAWVKAIEL